MPNKQPNKQFDKILRHTLQDFRLSRSERRTISMILHELNPTEHELAALRHTAFEIARQEIVSPDAHQITTWLEEVVKALQPKADSQQSSTAAYFSPDRRCPKKIAQLLDFAEQEIDICVFTITDDRISEAILDAHRRQIKLRIITDDDKSNDRGSDVHRFIKAGIQVRRDQSEYHMHHKYAIFDKKRLLTGSYNWTRGAAEYNEENFIVTEESQLVRTFSKEFNKLWKELKN